jgi:ferric-dicitrate binding protein FerR (iron transport regulator)
MNCTPRELLSAILVLSFACATLGADGSGAPGAVLQASGKVQVNGAGSRKTTTLFSGDSVQTNANSVANIIASGSSVLVNPNASVKFLGSAVEVDEGDVTITTSVGMAAKADALTIAPAPGGQRQAKFEVGENEDTVIIAALQGNVTVSDGQETSTTQEGQETTHKKKRKGGGAAPAATRWISVRNVAIITGSVIGTAILLDELDDYKTCISPPGTPGAKSCICKTDKNGKQTCREET